LCSNAQGNTHCNSQLNIVSIMYLFFRLAPFVIVSYFAKNLNSNETKINVYIELNLGIM
jgi:hypothetical protein